ncbi:MAG: hypothetical protein EAX86_00120 [Candidatus Heimdallarchaeota archaeon]|nr:hypothetical protein [Candidatus Heimdallarchaeota archaeon]
MLKIKILVADSIAASAVEKLKKEFDVTEHHYSISELIEVIEQYDAVIVRSATNIPQTVIERGIKLKVIGRAGVGVDNIDVEAATNQGIYVVNSPLASTITVAEMAFTFIMALSRKIIDANNETKAGNWPKKHLMGSELFKKTLGFIGCGRIGSEVVKRAQAFGMNCIIYDPYLPQEIFQKMGTEQIMDLDEIFARSDYITIHALLTDETRNMIGDRELSLMKPTAFIINCARGGIINEQALYKALSDEKIAGAGLDVFSEEPAKKNILFGLKNSYVSPHIGASTVEAQIRAGEITAEQVRLVLKGKRPEFCVNLHELDKK